MTRKRLAAMGGGLAGSVLVVFGVIAIAMGVNGVQTVHDNLAQENIVGTPDSTIPGQKVNTGDEALAFADVMRKHTLEATEGQTYAEMGRWLDSSGNPTNDENAAAVTAKGQPVENPLRQLWVTETALSTALNQAYFAERVGYFGIVTGVAMLLSGIGFIVLVASGVLRTAEGREPAFAPTAHASA